jgi:hypothetical protein
MQLCDNIQALKREEVEYALLMPLIPISQEVFAGYRNYAVAPCASVDSFKV